MSFLRRAGQAWWPEIKLHVKPEIKILSNYTIRRKILHLIWFYEVRIVEKRGWGHPKRLPPLVLVTSWGESLIRIMEWGGGGRMKGEGVEAEGEGLPLHRWSALSSPH